MEEFLHRAILDTPNGHVVKNLLNTFLETPRKALTEDIIFFVVMKVNYLSDIAVFALSYSVFVVDRSGLWYTAVFTSPPVSATFYQSSQKMAAKAPKTNHLRVSTHILPVHQLSHGFYSFLSSTEADCGICFCLN